MGQNVFFPFVFKNVGKAEFFLFGIFGDALRDTVGVRVGNGEG